MASGFCVRVLLLSLFGFVQHANALSFRSGGYSGTRHYQLAEDFPWSHKPAFAPPSYENAAQPRGHWGHSYPDRPAASAGRFSGSDGREVVSYSPEGSVSSYGSGSPIEQKPREKPQHQPNSSGNAYESAVVSSYGIQMQAEPQQPGYPPRPQQPGYPPRPQQPGYPPRPQQPGYPPKPQQPGYPPKPQQPGYPPKPQQPGYPPKPQQPGYPPKPQQPGYPPKPQQPGYPPKPQPSIVQSKAGMWDIALPQDDIAPSSSRPMASVYNRGQQQPAYPSKPQQPAYPSKPQQPAYPSKPQQPGVLQSKAGMWDIPLPQDDIAPSSSRPMASVYNRGQQQPGYPAKPQQQPGYPAKPQQQPGYPAKPQQQPGYPPKPQQQPGYPPKPQQQPGYPPKPQQQPGYPPKPQQQPGYPPKPQQQPGYPPKPQQSSVLQSKAGMWDIPLPQGGVAPRSSRPIPMASLQHPRWQRPLVPVYNRLYHP
ncbi:uncharacterized protein AB9X84_006253 [Acanthopagrus schlegelii]